MPEPIRTFDDRGMRAIRRDHQQLRTLSLGGETQSATRQNTDWGRVVRTGITTTNDDWPDYPAEGSNTFVVAIETWTFDEEPGAQDVTYNASEQFVIARTEDGSYIEEGEHVVIYKQQARGGRLWWIQRPVPLSIPIKTRTGGIPGRVGNTPGSATCDLLTWSPDDELVGAGPITIYNISDSDVDHCKVGLASPVRRTDGSIVYVIVVESCLEVELDSSGACPDDGIENTDDAEELPPDVPANHIRWEWTGSRWTRIGGSCDSGQNAIVPADAGEIGAQVDVECSNTGCRWVGDGGGGWTLFANDGCGACSTPPTYASDGVSHIVWMPCD